MYSSIPSVIQNETFQKENLSDDCHKNNNNNNNNDNNNNYNYENNNNIYNLNGIRQNNFFQAAPSYVNNNNNKKNKTNNNKQQQQQREEEKISPVLPHQSEQLATPSYLQQQPQQQNNNNNNKNNNKNKNNNNNNNNNRVAETANTQQDLSAFPFGRPTAVLFVGQINYEATENDVRFLFSFYGDVLRVVLFKANSHGNKNNNNNNNNNNKNNNNNNNDVDKTSAFVTYGSTAEADMAILSLHNRYCMDARERPLQVSYCLKTDIISEFGYRHALQLHAENPANPLPSFPQEKIVRNNNNNNNNNFNNHQIEEEEEQPLFVNELGEAIDTAVYYC